MLLILSFSYIFNTWGQNPPLHPNGLIYSDSTLDYLQLVHDSMLHNFEINTVVDTLYSKPQAKGHYIFIRAHQRSALQDIRKGIPINEFITKYQEYADIHKDLLIVKHLYYEDEERYDAFSGINMQGYDYEIKLKAKGDQTLALKNGSWIIQQTNHYLHAFYLTKDFQQTPIPSKYAKIIAYTDLVTGQLENPIELLQKSFHWDQRSYKNHDQFLKFVNDYGYKPPRPIFPAKPTVKQVEFYDWLVKVYEMDYEEWDSTRLAYIDEQLSSTITFQHLLTKATYDAMFYRTSSEELEYYISKYLSKKDAKSIQKNRHQLRTYYMAQDSGYVKELAKPYQSFSGLMKRHLHVINGLGLVAKRPYIRELDAIGVEVDHLLLGSVFRLEKVRKGHFFSHVARIGKALQKSQYQFEALIKMQEFLADESLDDYNRILCFFLYYYTISQKDEQIKKVHMNQIATLLPRYLHEQWVQ